MGFSLVTITTKDGPSVAVLADGYVLEVAIAAKGELPRDMLGLASRWNSVLPRLEKIATDAKQLGEPIEAVHLLAPILNPGAIFCAGANYQDHAEEMAMRAGRPPPEDPHSIGLRSWHFLKTSHCIAGPDAIVPMHPRAKRVDWEAELAVVIGRAAFQVDEADALDHVLGYTIANDLSARDLGRRDTLPESSSFKHDWVAHKNWDGSCPMGPWITLARDVPDPDHLSIVLDVNGVVKQRSNTERMIFNIKEQIADLSRNFTLWPGDVILTGTPAGVGAGRGEFLKTGDVIRVEIEGLGQLVTVMG